MRIFKKRDNSGERGGLSVNKCGIVLIGDGTVVSDVHDVVGNVVQSRDIHGDITISPHLPDHPA